MRKQVLLLSTMVVIFLASCQKQETAEVTPQAEPAKSFKSGVEDPCYDTTFLIYGGQTIEVGTLTVSNDEDEIFVTYDLSGTDWYLDETHLYVGSAEGIPATGSGNPKIGHFPYAESHEMEQVYTYTFLREDFEDCFAVAAHAAVEQYDANGNKIGEETAWADGGTEFPGKRWGWYLERFCVEDCVPDFVCNEAYAYFSSEDYPTINSTCFSEYGFSTNGWTIGPVDRLEIFSNPAGCPKAQLKACPSSCDPNAMVNIGQVLINAYEPALGRIYITFNQIPDGYGLEETYVYVGNEPFPIVNGSYSINPEDFTYSHKNLNGAKFDRFYSIPANGEVYVIAYAVYSQQ